MCPDNYTTILDKEKCKKATKLFFGDNKQGNNFVDENSEHKEYWGTLCQTKGHTLDGIINGYGGRIGGKIDGLGTDYKYLCERE